MRKRNFCLLLAAIIFVLASCQKEVSNEHGTTTPGTDSTSTPVDTTTTGSNTEVGTWQFVSLHATVSQTSEYSQLGSSLKTITTSDYTTQNNSGTIKFDGSKMIANAVTFTINTTAKSYVYLNGTLSDSLVYPLNTTISPQTDTASYQKIGTDSLFFQSGGLIDLGTGGALPSVPTGYKLKFSGNTMTMTTVYDNVTTDNSQGVPTKVTTHAVLVATLQKQ